MSEEPKMTGMDKKIFNATRTLTSLLNDACNHWNYLCPYLEKLAVVADDALRGYQKDYPEQVAELIDYRRERDLQGNAAAMREALREAIGETCAGCKRDCDDCMNLKSGWMKKAKAAISAPARNCDLKECSTDDGTISAHERFCKSWHADGNYCSECPYYPKSPMMTCREKWLLAPAAERKGEGDGIK